MKLGYKIKLTSKESSRVLISDNENKQNFGYEKITNDNVFEITKDGFKIFIKNKALKNGI